MSEFPLCPVPPPNVGDDMWNDSKAKLVEAFSRRYNTQEEAEKAADNYLRKHEDIADLRALGYCRHCGQQITLRQSGRCVYSSCGHYRVQGELELMAPYQKRRLETMLPERKEALLAMVGSALMDVAIEKDHHVRR